jgi:prepilin-type N-terminal cleavage/methylation domain-containing protein
MRSNNKGFTLIELLIVVVIIGILAAIAIPKFSEAREKAFVSAMKSDLKNLATQQELYYSDYFTYSSDETDANLGFTSSKNVTVSADAGTTTGWSASATHDGTDATCDIYYGDESASGSANASAAGVVACSTDAS